jgi:hypothetical protein
MPEPTFPEIWEALSSELEARNQQLNAQYEASFAAVLDVIGSVADRLDQESAPAPLTGAVSSLRAIGADAGERLLLEPVRSIRRARALERAIEAVESHNLAMEEMIRRLPQTVVVSGADLADTLAPHRNNRVRLFLMHRRERIQIPLRRMVRLHLLEESQRRARLDGSCLLSLARSQILLLSPWQELRRQGLLQLSGQEAGAEAWPNCRARWLRRAGAVGAADEKRLAALRAWTRGAIERLAEPFLRPGKSVARGKERRLLLRQQWNFRYWARQQRAITALLDLEWDLAKFLSDAAQSAADALAAIDAEQAGLLLELDNAIAWLRASQDEAPRGDFPPPVAHLLSAEDRVGAWEQSIRRAMRERLPIEVETVDPRRELPGRREPWRRLEPQREFVKAAGAFGRAIVVDGFGEVENAHRAIIQVIERAREVVRFSLETAAAEPEVGPALAREGIANALALVSHQKQSAADPHEAAESRLVQSTASTFLILHLGLEQHRVGLLTQLARQSGSRAARETWRVLGQQTVVVGRWLTDRTRDCYRWTLRKVGFEVASAPPGPPVESRGYLGEALSLQLGARDLPMIYQRLFRLAPVEEPRFLVGREAEMAALAHARNLWRTSRGVAIVLVGDRGSGKTSLLNCAVAAEFSDVEVIRGQFSQRVTDPEQMRVFLRELFGAPRDRSLLEALGERKRVVMLEELERTFLRRINGFGGLEELLSVVEASCRSTLWIISLNQIAFRYLDAAVGLGRYFSHRINAMAIPPAQLKNAILLRHNLSGLRLEYPSIPESNDRFRRIQQMLGLEQSLEDRFFDAVYRQSDGIFRSAFELWQHFMERAEGGVLYMRRPADPDYGPILRQFGQQDSFSLQAILQHGSLTEEEHAQIFECPPARSRDQMQRLLNLECLETDPAGPGLRIRPEAGRLVRTLLHRQNLI